MGSSGVLGTWLAPVLLFTVLCTGLELDLDLNASVQIGSRPACAVLQCVEESQPVTTSRSTSSQDGSIASLKNITSLALFKHSQSTRCGKDRESPGTLLASVTPKQPRLTRVSNGIKVEGVLDSRRASLTLELVKSHDCLADFTCELRTVDANGEESVSVARVHQSQGQSQVDSQSLMSSVSLQILDLVHQLDTKLAITSKSTEKLESKMEAIENSLNTKLVLVSKATEQLESKVNALENRLEDKIASSERALQDNIASLQNRIEHRIEDRVQDKLDEVHRHVLAFTTNIESCSESVRKSLNESLTPLKQCLNHEYRGSPVNERSGAHCSLDNHSNMTDTILSAVKKLSHTQSDLHDELLENLAEVLDGISGNGVNISKTINGQIVSMEQKLSDSFQQLASTVNHSTIETLNSANDLFLQTNATAITALKDLFSPKRCTRGMTYLLSSASYPYPLIQPSKDSIGIVDVPYLCDTVTDGGGWIIIQRRSSGDVDFYRGWEEYKNGFGDLKGDFYIGNENIHRITSKGSFELRVEIIYQGKASFARYGSFSVADEANSYRLTVGGYSGTAGDSMTKSQNGMQFTALDRDNDNHAENCAVLCTGGWWYNKCAESSLNGRWQATDWKGPFWYTFSNKNPVSFTEMKIRNLAVA